MKPTLQSTLEKTARVIGNDFGVRVEFEGDEALTNGTLIRLPMFAHLTEDRLLDLDGYLAHEVAHIKFTDFKTWNQIQHAFHRTLANLAEDVRIETLMSESFAGAGRNLSRLREKIEQEQDRKWFTLDLPFRFAGAFQRHLQGKTYPTDPEILPLLDLCDPEIKSLKNATSTKSVQTYTWKIVEKLNQAFQSPKPPSPDGNDGNDEGNSNSKEQPAVSAMDESTNEQNVPASEGPGNQDQAEGGEPSSGGTGSKPDCDQVDASPVDLEEQPSVSNQEASTSSETVIPVTPADTKQKESEQWESTRLKALKIMAGGDEHNWSEMQFGGDLGSVMRQEIQNWVEENSKSFTIDPETEAETKRLISNGETLAIPFLPASRRFDQETRLKGDPHRYSALRSQTNRARAKLRNELYRALFAFEKSEWRTEREEGEIDPQLLAGVPFGSREIFREHSQGETKNVVVSILVDCSSSMELVMGEQKKALCAIAETLKEMSIPFEIIGFLSNFDPDLANFSCRLPFRNRFNRTEQSINYLVAKDFRSGKLDGIESLKADGYTPLNEAVAWAGNRLERHPGNRKILLVFTDGEPCGCGDPRVLRNDLLVQIQRLESVGIEIIGFAIKCSSVGRFFPRSINIQNAKELEDKALKEVKELFMPVTRR